MAAEITVTNPEYWAGERALQLAQLLKGARTDASSTIGDPTGKPPDPENLFVVADPDYWAGQVQPLQELLAAAGGANEVGAEGSPSGGGVGAVSGSQGRLTMTVEEAAVALGISRAFAYEAVTRNEIPHIRIGRRILIPRAALEHLLGASETPDNTP